MLAVYAASSCRITATSPSQPVGKVLRHSGFGLWARLSGNIVQLVHARSSRACVITWPYNCVVRARPIFSFDNVPSIVSMPEDTRPPNDPTRTCDTCGRRGTWARITRYVDNSTIDTHYCRRCWPQAHRSAILARRAVIRAWHEEFDAAIREATRTGHEPRVPLAASEATSRAWHWSLLIGSHFRESWYHRPASSRPRSNER
jgi:hypothetical protein